MDREKKVYLEDPELSEADRVVLRLYEEAVEPVDWDESDDAILAFSRGIESSTEDGEPTPSAETAGEDSDDNVVAFAPRKSASSGRSFFRSPLAGFSIAASLMIGIFFGQGISPYVDLGVSPGYQEVLSENRQLTRSLTATRSIKLRAPDPQEPADSETADSEITDSGTAESEIAVSAESDLLQIGALLNDFRCADLSMTLSSAQGIKVSGHVSSVEDLDRLRSSLAEFQQLERVAQEVQVYGWPICQALEILATQTVMKADGARAPLVRPFNHGPVYVGGESLIVEARGTDLYEGYLYIDYVQNDGNVLHMLPFEQMPENAVARGQQLLLGAGDARYTLAAPYGTEMLIVVASPVPLFEAMRPEIEPAESYFEDLAEALEDLAEQGYGDQLLSSYSILTTKAQ